MSPMLQLSTKKEILEELNREWEKMNLMLANCKEESFLKKPEASVWSIAEELEHLMLSVRPINKAVKVNKMMLKIFGKPEYDPRSFDTIYGMYEKLQESEKLVTTSDFEPKEKRSLEEALTFWKSLQEKVLARIQKNWTEEELDSYVLPHPLLGKLSIREILFFTILHMRHHRAIMEEKHKSTA